MCMYVSIDMAWHTCGHQRMFGNWFSLFTVGFRG